MRNFLPAALLCCITGPARADWWGSHERIARHPAVGLVYQRELMVEMSYVRCYNELLGSASYRLGAESNLNGGHLLVAPKVTGEVCYILGIVRLSVADYWQTATGKHDFRLTPEIGVTYPNIAALTFGYNAHLFGFRNGYISGPKLSLTFYFDRDKIGNLIKNKHDGLYY